MAIGLLYYFGNVYQRAYYTALGVIPEDLQFSVQAMLAKSPDAIFLPLWFLLVCGLIVLLVLGWAGQSLSGPRHPARRSKVILWLLGSGLVLLLLGFPVFFWEKSRGSPAPRATDDDALLHHGPLRVDGGREQRRRGRSGPLPEESARSGPRPSSAWTLPPPPRRGAR